MEKTEIKNELRDLVEQSESIASLDALKRGILKEKLSNLSDLQAQQMIELLKDEKLKMEQKRAEIMMLSTEARGASRAIRNLIWKEKHKKEEAESGVSGEHILAQLGQVEKVKNTGKQNRLWMMLLVSIVIAAVAYLIVSKTI